MKMRISNWFRNNNLKKILPRPSPQNASSSTWILPEFHYDSLPFLFTNNRANHQKLACLVFATASICTLAILENIPLVRCEHEVKKVKAKTTGIIPLTEKENDDEEDWSDLGADKDTDCLLCLGFREGPCGNYWRRQEACMDKYKDNPLRSDASETKSNTNHNLPSWSEHCEKPFIAWNTCMQQNTEWYDSYFKRKANEQSNTIIGTANNIEQNSSNQNLSREEWNERLLILEEVVIKTMGPLVQFPTKLTPTVSFNTRNATGQVTFRMIKDDDNTQKLIIGFVRDDKGELLGVGQGFELEKVLKKGTLEFGGITGFTKYITVFALYEGKDDPLFYHKIDLKF